MNYKVSILHGLWQMVHKSDYQNDKDTIFLRILIIEYSLQQLANQHGVLTIMSFVVDHNFLLIWLFFSFCLFELGMLLMSVSLSPTL